MNPILPEDVVAAATRSQEPTDGCVQRLQRSCVELKKLDYAGRDLPVDAPVTGRTHTVGRVKYWGAQGAFWGGTWGWLFGTFSENEGGGPLLMAGPLVGWIVGALEGAIMVGGLSALAACLFSLGYWKQRSVLQEAQRDEARDG